MYIFVVSYRNLSFQIFPLWYTPVKLASFASVKQWQQSSYRCIEMRCHTYKLRQVRAEANFCKELFLDISVFCCHARRMMLMLRSTFRGASPARSAAFFMARERLVADAAHGTDLPIKRGGKCSSVEGGAKAVSVEPGRHGPARFRSVADCVLDYVSSLPGAGLSLSRSIAAMIAA